MSAPNNFLHLNFKTIWCLLSGNATDPFTPETTHSYDSERWQNA